jgi:hypothetical protein
MFIFFNLIAGIERMISSLKFKNEKNNIDDEPIKGTKTISDIYQRCNIVAIKPSNYEEAATDQK